MKKISNSFSKSSFLGMATVLYAGLYFVELSYGRMAKALHACALQQQWAIECATNYLPSSCRV